MQTEQMSYAKVRSSHGHGVLEQSQTIFCGWGIAWERGARGKTGKTHSFGHYLDSRLSHLCYECNKHIVLILLMMILISN